MSVVDKFISMLGMDAHVPEEPEDYIEVKAEEEPRDRRNNLVSITGPKNVHMKVVVCEPNAFDEVQEIADNLRQRRQVIINLEKTPSDTAQRIIDFVSGTVYALDGHTQKLAENIVMFVPSNVEIVPDHKNILRSPYTFSSKGKSETW
ncbi:MAG: cell division protein SepF [Methylocystaceae bacterium]